jgi:hypothetical protein
VPSPKYVGVETEYGIAVDGPSEVNPVVASSLVVGAYRAGRARTCGGTTPTSTRCVTPAGSRCPTRTNR